MLMRHTKAKPAANGCPAQVIWLCACGRYWSDCGLLLECVSCFYCLLHNINYKLPKKSGEDNSHILFFCNRPMYRVSIELTRVEVWENEKCCGNTTRRWVFPQLFRVLQDFYERFYNSIETRRTFSICFRKHREEKKENNLLTLIIKI